MMHAFAVIRSHQAEIATLRLKDVCFSSMWCGGCVRFSNRAHGKCLLKGLEIAGEVCESLRLSEV